MADKTLPDSEYVRKMAAALRMEAQGYVDGSGCMKGRGLLLEDLADALEAQSARISKLEEALKEARFSIATLEDVLMDLGYHIGLCFEDTGSPDAQEALVAIARALEAK